MNIPELYQPDGNPIDGPRTTAAEYAHQLFEMETYQRSRLTDDGLQWVDVLTEEMWRNAAAEEGERYAEAIRGGRLYRVLANDPRYRPEIDAYVRDYARAR